MQTIIGKKKFSREFSSEKRDNTNSYNLNMGKLIISVIAFMMMATTNALADSKVISGDVNVLRDANATFSVEYDFSKTIVEGTPYKQYVAGRKADWQRDWPEDQKEGLKSFIKKWNNKNKKGMKASETGGTYRMVIKPTELHFGSAALALTIGFGAGGMKMSGTLELYKGNKRVLVIEVKDQTGKSAMTETQRYRSLMQELADDTYKDILK